MVLIEQHPKKCFILGTNDAPFKAMEDVPGFNGSGVVGYG